MGLNSLSWLVLAIAFVPTHQTRRWVSIKNGAAGEFIIANEHGLVISNRNSIVFKVQACSDAIIALSDIVSIADNKGRYLLLMIGVNGNTEIQARDSCFKCKLQRVVTPSLLDCNAFKTFWMQWESNGRLKLGTGTVIGSEIKLDFTGQKVPYTFHFVHVTSTKKGHAIFRFPVDIPLRFAFPAADGSTVISVNETEALNVMLLEVRLNTNDTDVVLDLHGEGNEDFLFDDNKIRLRNKLNFERKAHYTLVIGSDEGVSVAVTVSVLDQNDETPSLKVFPGTISEKIPAGTLIGGFYTTSDLDKGDNLSFSLSGTGSDRFVPLGHGLLKVSKSLDDHVLKTTGQLYHLTLTVTDLAGHMASGLLKLTVLDLNDPSQASEPDYLNQSHVIGGGKKPVSDTKSASTSTVILAVLSAVEAVALACLAAVIVYKKLNSNKMSPTAVLPERPDPLNSDILEVDTLPASTRYPK